MMVTAYAVWCALPAWKRLSVRAALALASFVAVAAAVAPLAGASVDPGVASAANPALAGDGQQFLIVHRWTPIQFEPSGFVGLGSSIQNAPYALRSWILGVVVLAARVLMTVMTLAAGGDLVSSAGGTVDRIFAAVGQGALGDGSSSPARAITIVALMLVALVGLSVWRMLTRGSRAGLRTLGTGMAALALLVAMSSGAAQNTRELESSGAAGVGVSAPADFSPAVLSPQWVMARGAALSALVGNYMQTLLTSAASAIDAPVDSANSECDRYIESIHYSYLEAAGGQDSAAGHVVVAMDNLLVATLWDTNRTLVLDGANASSNASWCRLSEMDAGTPAAEQAALSRQAGLYSDIVGYDPAVAMPGLAGQPVDGSAMSANGDVTDAGLLEDVFGPAFASGDTGSRAMYFWAACQWEEPGGPVTINPAWADVEASAVASETWLEAAQSNAGWSLLGPGATLIATVSDLFDGDDHPGTLGEANVCQNVVANGLVSDETAAAGRSLQYGESYFLQDTLRPWNVSALDFFDTPRQAGDLEAYNYYRATQALNSATAVSGGFAAAAGGGLFLWMVLPVSLGLLMSQLVGIIAWILLPVVLVVSIVPTERTKPLAMMALRAIGFSMLAALMFQLVIQFTVLTYELITHMLVPEDSTTWTRWFLQLLAAVLAFFVVKKVSKAVFVSDVTTFRGAFRTASQVAARPVMERAGRADANYGLRRPSWMSRATSTAAGAATLPLRRAVAEKIGGMGRSGDATPKPTSAPPGTTTTAHDKPQTGVAGKVMPAPSAEADKAAQDKVGSAGPRPAGGPQVRGAFAIDPTKDTFTIPRDGTIAVGGAVAAERDIESQTISTSEYSKLPAQDRKAYTFDPVTGGFVPKLALGASAENGLSETISAPLSALTQDEAPRGVGQEDWDKTRAMRAQIAAGGSALDIVTPERQSLIDAQGRRERVAAEAIGAPLPEAPTDAELIDQAPGLQSAGDSGARGRATVLERHADGSPRVLVEGSRGDRLVHTELDAAGQVLARAYERDGQRVEREYSDGRKTRERWLNGSGELSRADGPATLQFDAEGSVSRERYFLGGQEMSAKEHGLVMDAARDQAQSMMDAGGRQRLQRAASGGDLHTYLPDAAPAVAAAAMEAAIAASLGAASIPSISFGDVRGLDESALRDMGAQAAQAVLAEPEVFAQATSASVEQVTRAARAALSGASASPEAMRQLVWMAQEAGTTAIAESLRSSLMDEAARDAVSSAVVSQATYMSVMQQEAVAAAAARIAQAQAEALASAMSVDPGEIAAAAQAVAAGSAQSDQMEQVLLAVREHASGEAAERLRVTMDELAAGTGPMATLSANVDHAVAQVAQMSERMHDERISAITQRLERELRDARARAEDGAAGIAQAFESLAAEQLDVDGPGGASEASLAAARRDAVARRAELDERIAAQMGRALDSASVELANARVGDQELEALAGARDQVLRDFRRLQGLRGWFAR